LRLSLTPATRRAVIGWLDGIRLTRLRLLDLLAAHQVAPIPTVGHPFDPHCHVAAATDTSGRGPDGTIVGEDRRGYATPEKVLRFAEVVVARSGKS
jgi:molecular chaperone GrpE